MLELTWGTIVWVGLLLLTLLVALPSVLLLLQVSMARRSSSSLPTAQRPQRIAVLIPAHNEGRGLLPTLQQALAQLCAQDRVLVVADNCDDDTADQARRLGGVTVVERQDPLLRGKGYALDFGVRHLERLAQQDGLPPDVVIVLDADCLMAPGLLSRIASVACNSGRPVQATYLMHAANNGLKARIAEFAMRVKNLVRPRGMHQLGLPCGLYGTGMAFPWAVVVRAPLASGHLAEDMQLGVRLAQSGTPPLFCEDALITSSFAASQQGSASQRTRWEHGHLAMLVDEGPRLLWRALRNGRWTELMQVLDMLVPPLALLAMLQVAWAAALTVPAWYLGWVVPWGVSVLAVLMLVGAVVLAQRRYARDLLSLQELASAPLFMLTKVPLYLRFLIRRQVEWVRTKRDH